MQRLWQEVHTKKPETQRSMNIIALAFDMAKAVEVLIEKAKRYFYSVMLIGYRCPECNGRLEMIGEGQCRCNSCNHDFDPTIEFQRCSSCGGLIKLIVRRYQCRTCEANINSRFLFDGLVFDRDYFRTKMLESRQRKSTLRESVRQMLAEGRSDPLALEAGDLNSVPGLVEALNSLTSGLEESILVEWKEKFDMNRYQDHVREYIGTEPVNLREIPPLIENLRLDLIWRFIAIIFLAQTGGIEVQQEKEEILVAKVETYR